MVNEFWLNLPVKDLTNSTKFFTELGFTIHPQDGSVQLIIGDAQSGIMLFPESTFKQFTRNEIANPMTTSEVLLSVSAESREEVDLLMKKALEAGGEIFSEPQESQGWMYGGGFTDLDGHRWNVLYMDMSELPEM